MPLISEEKQNQEGRGWALLEISIGFKFGEKERCLSAGKIFIGLLK